MAYNYFSNPYNNGNAYAQGWGQQTTPQQPARNQMGFIRIPSEDYARNFPVAPGDSVAFIDENAPYCYVKTADTSPLGHFKFEKYKITKEEENAPERNPDAPAAEHALRADLEALRKELEDFKNSFAIKKKEKKNDE